MLFGKNKNLKKFLAVSALGVCFAAMPNAVQAQDNTYKWATFEDIDVDKSGFLETGEYQAYAFGKADWDNDGYLEETEWASYTEVYYDPWEVDYDSYTYYDTDGDGFIDRTEFNEVPTATLFDTWDYDGNGIRDDDWDRVTAHYYDSE